MRQTNWALYLLCNSLIIYCLSSGQSKQISSQQHKSEVCTPYISRLEIPPSAWPRSFTTNSLSSNPLKHLLSHPFPHRHNNDHLSASSTVTRKTAIRTFCKARTVQQRMGHSDIHSRQTLFASQHWTKKQEKLWTRISIKCGNSVCIKKMCN